METRQRATEMLSALLGISHVSAESLFDLASQVLRQSRTERCLELSRLARLSRRSAATGAVAEFIAGTRLLGETWWARPHLAMLISSDLGGQRRLIRWEDRGTPDAYLAGPEPRPDRGVHGPTILESVGYWIQDDAVDHQWGRPVDYVDLNVAGTFSIKLHAQPSTETLPRSTMPSPNSDDTGRGSPSVASRVTR